MKYHRYKEDWVTHLEGDFRAEVLELLRGLHFERLQKYPPPKIGGLPFGNETRVAERFIRGESSQLDASALSHFYRSFADEHDRLLYSAFRTSDPLPREKWAEAIGAENIDKWIANKFLRETEDGLLQAKFGIVALDGLLYLIDPLNDHGLAAQTEVLDDSEVDHSDADIQPFHHAYIGLDSLRQIEVMSQNRVRKGKRYLDCGQGAGAILLYFSRRFEEAVGIDINSRAVKVANFNAELNGLANVKAYEDNALELNGKYGKFDLVSWNLPFMFMPEEGKDDSIDAYGGELGIGLCLDFIETLPGLLADKGQACIAALAPIMTSGENVLETRLRERLPRLGLDCTVRVAQVSLAHTRELWHFHKEHGIRRFESVYLYFKHGRGELERVEPSISRKILDVVREEMYKRKFA